jgi:hypothetical protein|tara:strand:+ start:136 stop:300 length:165 start_codon:yes stop_codon:yes gene_type:complete
VLYSRIKNPRAKYSYLLFLFVNSIEKYSPKVLESSLKSKATSKTLTLLTLTRFS